MRADWTAIAYKAILGLLVGSSLSQWGHFLTQELYGRPWSGFGAIFIKEEYRLPMYQDSSHFFPIFLFGAIWFLMGAAWLIFDDSWQGSRIAQANGALVGVVWFIVGRIALEIATPNVYVNGWSALILLIITVSLGISLQKGSSTKP